MTLDHVASNLLPRPERSNKRKMVEFAVGALWHLGLNCFQLQKRLNVLCLHTDCLCMVTLCLLQALCLLWDSLVILPRVVHVPLDLESIPVRDLSICDQDFLMPFLCHFGVVCGVVLGLGYVCMITQNS